MELHIISTKGKFIIASLPEIDDCDAAAALRNTEIYVNISATTLDDSEFFFSELNDMEVLNIKNKKIGIVLNTANFGAGDIIEIKFLNDKVEMFPFTKELFPNIDRQKKQLSFAPPEEA